jgi:HEAT repeat protein/sugar phosphate permease
MSEVTTVQKIRRLPWSIAANTSNMTFIQLTFSGSVFVLFLSELGLGKGATGFQLSLMPFAGALALLAAPYVARHGYKRTYITFFGARTLVAAFLLLTPWVMARFGEQATFYFVTAVVALFSMLRAIGMTAYFPWAQDFVPGSMRGKYAAIDSAVGAAAGFIAIIGAKFVLEWMPGLSGFMVLMGIALCLGICAIVSASRIPGGAPLPADAADTATKQEMLATLRDPDFRTYLIGIGLFSLATTPMFGFLPLFMQEEVGLDAGNIVLLQAGTLIGGILTSYLWGWLADRYGSKPILLAGLSLLLLIPLAWLFMPRQSNWSLVVALGIAFLLGIATLGWNTGANRLLYVNVVPPEQKNEYMAVYFAWAGLIAGIGQLIGGWVLNWTEGLNADWGFLRIDPYTPLFVAGFIFPLVSLFLLRAVRTSDAISPGEFVNLFLRGNFLLALEGLIGLSWAKDEETAVEMTERLGQAESPVATEELVLALSDPRFWVRFEALIAIAHMPPNEQLRGALVETLNSGEPVLSVVAAWALGRMRDQEALEPLRQSLEADDSTIKGYSARSLGILNDHAVVPVLLERLQEEDDLHLQLAYASALGQLRVREAIPQLLDLLRRCDQAMARTEVALALARMMGNEQEFLQLLRQANQDAAVATSQALLTLKKRINGSAAAEELLTSVEECAETLGREQLDEGVELIRCLVEKLPQEQLPPHCCTILQSCVECLADHRSERLEYVVLTLHAMNSEWQPAPQLA